MWMQFQTETTKWPEIASHMLGYIVRQMREVNCEKGHKNIYSLTAFAKTCPQRVQKQMP